MTRIPRDKLVYGFGADTPPVVRISSGDFITLETHITSSGRIHRLDDVPEFVRTRTTLKVNPRRVPSTVEDAEPGDALAVKILQYSWEPYGFVRALARSRGAPRRTAGSAGNDGAGRRRQSDLWQQNQVQSQTNDWCAGHRAGGGTVYTAHPGSQGSNMDFNAAVGTTDLSAGPCAGALLRRWRSSSMGDGRIGTGVESPGKRW
ncbi:MAG: acetamidase/formamidase family protein [Thermomicrobiales bacterium]